MSEHTSPERFMPFPISDGMLQDLRSDRFPTFVHGWQEADLSMGAHGTHFGFVYDGSARLRTESGGFDLGPGMYFSVPGRLEIEAQGSGLVITALHHTGLFALGGPIESRGRLRYIDGCTDTLLLSPVLRGAPCLSLLHIPRDTHQTPHTHPSLRAGLIARGTGRCVTPKGETALCPGLGFVILADTPHSFHTDAQDLLVIAYHPDSDVGPSHEEHPMVTRTLVDGVSASRLPQIATRNGELRG